MNAFLIGGLSEQYVFQYYVDLLLKCFFPLLNVRKELLSTVLVPNASWFLRYYSISAFRGDVVRKNFKIQQLDNSNVSLYSVDCEICVVCVVCTIYVCTRVYVCMCMYVICMCV